MKTLLIFILVIAGLVVYLNRSYAFFYDYHSAYLLIKPAGQTDFVIQYNESSQQEYTFIALGDSLTAGVGADSMEDSYPYLLANDISKKNQLKVHLKDLAVPGANTADILASQIYLVPESADLISILIGTNDVHNVVPAEIFEANLKSILNNLEHKKTRKVVLFTIPYIGADDTLLFPYNTLLSLRIGQFNGIIERLSKRQNVVLIDLYGLTTEIRKDPKYYAKDKFHPSSYGYKKWSEVIINASGDKLP